MLLVHLCDLHIQDRGDWVLGQSRAIAEAIRSEITPGIETIVLICGGDAANHGSIEQFEIARTFLFEIYNELKGLLPNVALKLFGVPGNHDCDFSADQTARDNLITTLPQDKLGSESVLDLILAPLQNYFRFCAEFPDQPDTNNVWFQRVQIDCADGPVVVNLLNTAWISRRGETPGSLHFPISAIQQETGDARLSITIMHHPLNWFHQPSTMRPMRSSIEDVSDLVITAHEHCPDAGVVSDRASRHTVYAEGGVLQERDAPGESSFITVRVDVANSDCCIRTYTFEGDHYCRAATITRSLSNATSPHGCTYDLADAFVEELDDLGIPVHHPHAGRLSLQDVFLYPDLWELDKLHAKQDGTSVRSEAVVTEVLSTKRLIVTGDEKSGKTCLAKSLFRDLHREGYAPVLLDGTTLQRHKNESLVRSSVTRQYTSLTADQYFQQTATERIAIVDSFHAVRHIDQLITFLDLHFHRVILIGDHISCLDEFAGHQREQRALWHWRHFFIIGFGEVLRESLASRWLSLGRVTDDGPTDIEVRHTCRVMNEVLQAQLIPCYPLFLLVVLQHMGVGQPAAQGGSYGHLFNAVVTFILGQSKQQRLSIKDKYGYLAALAFVMFQRGVGGLPESEVQQWHTAYWKGIGVDIDFDALHRDLHQLGMIDNVGGLVSFRYKYCRCFFAAYFLEQSLHEDGTRAEVVTLFGRLHEPEAADVALFLSHLSTHPIIIEEMIKCARRLLAEEPLATFEGDVEPLNTLGTKTPSLMLPRGSSVSRHQELLRQADENLPDRDPETTRGCLIEEPGDTETHVELGQIHASFKTIQILGQALRNNAGSMRVEDKSMIINEVLGLGRRLLGLYLGTFEKELPELTRTVADHIRSTARPTSSIASQTNAVTNKLFAMSELVAFSVTKHVSQSVTAELLSPTLAEVLKTQDSMASRVFDLSISLDGLKRFPAEKAVQLYELSSGNLFVGTLVRLLVYHHLYLFNVGFRDKQRVCSKLELNCTPKLLNPTIKRVK